MKCSRRSRSGTNRNWSARYRFRKSNSRSSPKRKSGNTSRPASATTRPAHMRSRAAPRNSSPSCAAAFPASWGCRCMKRRNCWSAWEHSVSDEILVNVTPQETRVAVLAAGQVQELLIERAASRGLVGNIYMGKVARVLPGMQSAFVEIGLERAAFLHVADIWEERQNGANNGDAAANTQKPIEKILAEGQPLLVQVVKDPIGTKGARLSTQISIAGRMLVHLPQDAHIGISQRIEDESGRALLLDRVKQILPADEKGGFIIRTMAETAPHPPPPAELPNPPTPLYTNTQKHT